MLLGTRTAVAVVGIIIWFAPSIIEPMSATMVTTPTLWLGACKRAC